MLLVMFKVLAGIFNQIPDYVVKFNFYQADYGTNNYSLTTDQFNCKVKFELTVKLYYVKFYNIF